MANPVTLLQTITVFFWLAAGIVHVVAIFQYPKQQQPERFYYILPVLTYMLHVAVFYAAVIATNWGVAEPAGNDIFRSWSVVLRLHGALALGIKEAVAIYRQGLKNKLGLR